VNPTGSDCITFNQCPKRITSDTVIDERGNKDSTNGDDVVDPEVADAVTPPRTQQSTIRRGDPTNSGSLDLRDQAAFTLRLVNVDFGNPCLDPVSTPSNTK
jgi:hypothetical protein